MLVPLVGCRGAGMPEVRAVKEGWRNAESANKNSQCDWL